MRAPSMLRCTTLPDLKWHASVTTTMRSLPTLRSIFCFSNMDSKECVDCNGNTPLHEAARKGNWLLLCTITPAEAMTKTSSGRTPLHLAAWYSRTLTVRFLLRANPSAALCSDAYGLTPLHLAAMSGQDDANIIKALLFSGADANSVDGAGMTPLHYAAWLGQLGSVLALLRGGALADIPDKKGKTALHYAGYDGNAAVTRALVEKGASVDAVCVSGMTPLHIAARFGNPDAVCVLLQLGADARRTSYGGRTALEYAKLNMCRGIVGGGVIQVLKEYGV